MHFPAKTKNGKTNLISDMFWSLLSNSLFIFTPRDLYLGQVYDQSPSSHSARSSLSFLRLEMCLLQNSESVIRRSSRPIHIPYESPGPVLVTAARISNIQRNWPTYWYLKHTAQQRTPHLHSFTCVRYWYASHYNENISTRRTAIPLPLPSTWKDFVICLLRSDFVIHLCWAPDRCLLANF